MITYLVLAELVNGSPVLFGIDVDAQDWEGGIPKLWEELDKDKGQRFLKIRDLQALMKVRYIKCPKCHELMTPQGQCTNGECREVMTPAQMKEAASQGLLEGTIRVEMASKAFQDGTINAFRLRPEHIVMVDIIPEDSPAYKVWKAGVDEVAARMRKVRTGLETPTAGDVIQFGKGKR